jgi:hypothetical protein
MPRRFRGADNRRIVLALGGLDIQCPTLEHQSNSALV